MKLLWRTKLSDQFEKARQEAAKAQGEAATRVKAELAASEKQIDLLLDMRLNEQISETEYISASSVLWLIRKPN